MYPGGHPYPRRGRARADLIADGMPSTQVVFAYSATCSHEHVMHLGSRAVNAAGCGLQASWARIRLDHAPSANVPVVSVTAVRTGSGKSQTTRRVVEVLQDRGRKDVVVIRHPMPYGDLVKQRVQRFAALRRSRHSTTARSRSARSTSRTSATTAPWSTPASTTPSDPARGREGSRRHPVGRWQQRPAAGPAPGPR